MANGDLAAANGYATVPGTADRRMGYDEINKSRDYIAQEKISRTTALSGKANTSHTHAAGDVSSGTLAVARIPSLPATIITSGTLSAARLPDHSASLITSGTLSAARLPSSLEANGPTDTAYARTATGSSWFAVWMNSSNQFMRNTSSRRYKEEIRPLELDVAAILALEPVTYHRKGQAAGTREIGLIAERCVDVPGLVTWDQHRDRKGQVVEGSPWRPEAVRYEQVLPVLLLHVIRQQEDRIAALEAAVGRLAGSEA